MSLPKIYKGFSTQNADVSHDWTSYDTELVKKDLLNHFNTRLGERVMRPSFGCKIWDYMMEPLTPENKDAIINEVVRVVSSDPRATLESCQVFDLEYGLRLEVTLSYVGTEVYDSFAVNFEDKEAKRVMGQLGF
jgi:phage baseplate assembly protein W